jgi:ABC-type bacteriocin/lantibiotic exporter with double-glycine peptidase domain
MILDEPTSAMDHETEARILKNLEDYFSGRTILFCTHRRSFIEKATRVIVLDNKGISLDISAEEYLSKIASLEERQKIGQV